MPKTFSNIEKLDFGDLRRFVNCHSDDDIIAKLCRLRPTEVSFLLGKGFEYDYDTDTFISRYMVEIGEYKETYFISIYKYFYQSKTTNITSLNLEIHKPLDGFIYDKIYERVGLNEMRAIKNYSIRLVGGETWESIVTDSLLIRMKMFFDDLVIKHKETISLQERNKKLSFTKFVEENKDVEKPTEKLAQNVEETKEILPTFVS